MHYQRLRANGSLHRPEPPDLSERFWRKVEKTEDCWIWRGEHAPNGYGQFQISKTPRVRRQAHRWIWETLNGPIEPTTLQVDHICRNRRCVRPDHLRLLSQRDNILCGAAPSAINASKTECIHGHPFTPENTYRTKRGHRQCRTCGRLRYTRHRQAHCGAP